MILRIVYTRGMPHRPDDEDFEGCLIELGRRARARLARMGRDAGVPPLALASCLLSDLLLDDERQHGIVPDERDVSNLSFLQPRGTHG